MRNEEKRVYTEIGDQISKGFSKYIVLIFL